MENDLLKAQQNMGVSPDREEAAKKELAAFGIEALPANIEMVLRSMESKQVNESERPIYETAKQVIAGDSGKEEELKKLMTEKGIKEVVHAEGPAIWDHVKFGLEKIEKLEADEKKKKFYQIVFLFHDIGKTDPAIIAANAPKNENPLNAATGQYNIKFVGHATFEKMSAGAEDTVRRAFEANGFSPEEIELGIWLVGKHMSAGIIEPDSKLANAVKIYNETTPEGFIDFIEVVKLDGEATVHYSAETGFGENEKKATLNSEKLLANIKTYNEVIAGLAPDPKIRGKQEQAVNEFFNKVKNFDNIDEAALAELRKNLDEIQAAGSKKIEVPPELKRLGGILRDKTAAVAEVYPSLVKLKDNERALQGIVNGQLKNKIGLTDEQVEAVLKTLE